MKLVTCGYQGLTPEQLFDLLTTNQVRTIVDLREIPLSRKPGFSKSALAVSASMHDLSYIHMPALGCPRDIRHDYRADHDWARYTTRFMSYLNTQNDVLQQLAELVQQENCCLLCFEDNPNFCHRSFVAQQVAALVRFPLTVTHLRGSNPTLVAPKQLSSV